MKKKILLILLVLGLFIISGCSDDKKEETKPTVKITDFNGIYKNGKNEMHIVATGKETLEYYVIDELENRNYGTLTFNKGIAANDDIDNLITVQLNDKNIEMKIENKENYPDGKYERTGNYSLDEFYIDSYGKEEFLKSKFNGKFIDGEDSVYSYQPNKNHIIYFVTLGEDMISCEGELDEDDDVLCTIIDTKYILRVDGDKLTFKAKSKNKKDNYEKTFTKEKALTKEDIINSFEPFETLDD